MNARWCRWPRLMKNKHADQRVLRRLALWLGLVAFAAWFLFWPLNQYIESPGSADRLQNYVTVKGHPDRYPGSFMITSVYLQQARPATYLWAKLTPYASLEPADAVTGGQDAKTYTRVQDFYMHSAINEAIAVAYQAAGQSYHKEYLGIYVLQIQPNSAFKKHLRVGDTITAVNGHHFDTAQGFQHYIARQRVGQRLTITYLHDGTTKTATAPLVRLPGARAGIGILLTDNVKVTTKLPAKINPGQIGGPSGGLMFALQVYEQLTRENLRHGRKIAGTGTINPDGSVGEIGGIDKKVVAAHRAGATIFFAPYVKPTKALLKYEEGHQTNYQLARATAKKVAPKMRVVPVANFKDALNYLQTHP